jgi:hypothetical protein
MAVCHNSVVRAGGLESAECEADARRFTRHARRPEVGGVVARSGAACSVHAAAQNCHRTVLTYTSRTE